MTGLIMNTKFCKFYMGDGLPPSNRYCRQCEKASIACNKLWQRVIDLANSQKGEPINLFNTNAKLYLNPNNRDIVYLRVNAQWNLPKEDFLHFIATGHAQLGKANQRNEPWTSPSLTRQEPYVNAIVTMLGGWNNQDVLAVKEQQK
jgi:hypothetical protein